MDFILLIIVLAVDLMLALAIMRLQRRSSIAQAYALMSLAIAAWLFTNFYTDSVHVLSGNWNDFYARGTYLTAFLTTLTMWLYSRVFPFGGRLFRRSDLMRLPLVLAMAWLSLSRGVVDHMEFSSSGMIEHDGPLIGLYYGLLLFVAGIVVYHFIQSYRRADIVQRNQLRYVLFAWTVVFVLSVMNNFVVPNLFSQIWPASIGNFVLTTIFLGCMGYASFRNRYVDIRWLATQIIAYCIAAGAVMLTVLLAGELQENDFGRIITTYSVPTLILVSFLLVLTVPELVRRLRLYLLSRFYARPYDTQTVLQEFAALFIRDHQLGRLTHASLRLLCRTLEVDTGFIGLGRDGHLDQWVTLGTTKHPDLSWDQLMSLGALVVADEVRRPELRQLLTTRGLRLGARLETAGGTVGFILLGAKKTGDVFDAKDVRLIEVLQGQLALAIANIQAYNAIADFNDTLKHRVDSATAKLSAANRNLRSLDHLKDDFISLGSHQLRTPLSIIRGSVDILITGEAGKVTKTQMEYLQQLQIAGDRMMQIVSNLVEISKVEAGLWLIEAGPADLSAIVKGEVDRLAPTAREKGLKFSYTLEGDPWPTMTIDEDKTRHVVSNFIENAIAYTPTGSVQVRLVRTSRTAEFTVTDTGIGVPSAIRNQLFTKFYRADEAKRIRPDGSGLGLYLSKRVIEDQGGTIVFESANQGSTFGFRLPLAPKPRKEPHA